MFKKMSAFSRIMLFSFLVAAIVAAIGATFVLVNNSTANKQVKEEVAIKIVDNLMPKINVHTKQPVQGTVSNLGISIYDTLPDISRYPILNQTQGDFVVEIISSTEKATISDDHPHDAWLVHMAEEFNKTNPTVNGRVGQIGVRGIASGVAKDYIISGKHVPPLISLSNKLWADDMKAQGIPIETLSERIAGNVAGIAINPTAYKKVNDKYGTVTVTTILQAVTDNEITFAYSNPLASSTGANLLLSILRSVDPQDMFGDKAVSFFAKFQTSVDLVAYTTLQIATSVDKGKIDAFVTEAQQFVNQPEYKAYQFIAFGVRNDNPLHLVGEVSAEQRELARQFHEFLQSKPAQARATSDGFNQYDNYVPADKDMNGSSLSEAQTLYKEKKSGSKKVVAMFVIDSSGSMNGAPMNSIQQALKNSVQYIGEECVIGVVSFADDVYIEMPLTQFTEEARANFVGAVNNLDASGGTAIYDGLAVASKLISDYKKQHSDIRPVIFLMSDGVRYGGLTYNKVEKMLIGFKTPINTVSYNGEYPYLKDLSNLNEGAYIRADSEDVAYKLAAFFNSEL